MLPSLCVFWGFLDWEQHTAEASAIFTATALISCRSASTQFPTISFFASSRGPGRRANIVTWAPWLGISENLGFSSEEDFTNHAQQVCWKSLFLIHRSHPLQRQSARSVSETRIRPKYVHTLPNRSWSGLMLSFFPLRGLSR